MATALEHLGSRVAAGLAAAAVVVVAAAAAPVVASQTRPEPSATPALPLRAPTPEAFLSAPWTIEGQVHGDLDGDRRDDVAVTWVPTVSAVGADSDTTERQRALLILLRQADGQYRRVAFTETVLQCPSCGGAYYGTADAPVRVAIVKGIVVVTQEHGSRNVVEQTFRFKYEPMTDRLWLVGLDLSDEDRATGQLVRQSTNFLTGQRMVTKSQFDQGTQQFVIRSRTRSRAGRSRIPIEQVDYRAY